MSNEIDVFPTYKQAFLLKVKHAGSALPAAKVRDRLRQQRAHRELVHLVQRLFLNGPQSPQAVVFSAAESGSGCTFVCTRTAAILASQLEEPVCVVDANFWSSGIGQQFAFEDGANTTQYAEWTLMPVGMNYSDAKTSNLWLASCKSAMTDRRRLVNLEHFQTLIEDLRKDFNYILVDAPPLAESSEAAGFARATDGLVLVLQAHDTRREVAQRAKELLDAGSIPVLGAVLNKRTYPIPEFIYRRL
ncbi:MAG TPA: P-loop NTPase [Terriglobia bacterium]|jgi:Mrp family chromosome partitioning ATPase